MSNCAFLTLTIRRLESLCPGISRASMGNLLVMRSAAGCQARRRRPSQALQRSHRAAPHPAAFRHFKHLLQSWRRNHKTGPVLNAIGPLAHRQRIFGRLARWLQSSCDVRYAARRRPNLLLDLYWRYLLPHCLGFHRRLARSRAIRVARDMSLPPAMLTLASAARGHRLNRPGMLVVFQAPPCSEL